MTQTQTINPFVTGNYAPVRDEVTVTDMEVRGQIPRALNGHYVRNGPNPIADATQPHHWFTGDGMVHGIVLDSGRARTYRNRWIRTSVVAEHLHEQHVPGPSQPFYDSSNTNVVRFAGQTMSLTEGCYPYVLGDDLETTKRADFGGRLPFGLTAHPKIDPTTGELHGFAFAWEEPSILYHLFSPSGDLVRTDKIELSAPVSMHDFAITANHIVFLDQPAVFDLNAMTTSGYPYRWMPENGARLGLLRRDVPGGAVTWIDVPMGYTFHVLNAFESDGKLMIDLPLIPDAYASDEFESGADGFLGLQRWTVTLSTNELATQVIDDTPQEFCRVRDDLIGQPHRFGYTIELGATMPYERTRLFKHDLVAQTRDVHDFGPGRHPGEFIFVVDPERGADEDGGWLMGFVHDDVTSQASLEILDAQDISRPALAEVLIPRRIPFGFHGNWIAR